MKNQILAVICGLSVAGVALAEGPGEIPFDFPAQEKLNAEVGQVVLGIDPYRLAAIRKKADSMVSYTNFVVTEVGAFESKVKRVSEATIPNALLMPMPKGEQVEVGDVLITWWQSGGGMNSAIVVGGTPSTPVVRYLTLPDNIDAAKQEHTLGPETFSKLDTPFELGSNVAFSAKGKWTMGTIVSASGGKLLVLPWGNKLQVVSQSSAKPIPGVPEKLKKGKVVWVDKYGTMGPAKVLKIDKKLGKVTVQLEFMSKAKEVRPYGQILTEAP